MKADNGHDKGKQMHVAAPKFQYAYEAQKEDELTIREGDVINVLSKEIEDQGWFKGELNGKVGVFPGNFVELIRMPCGPMAASASVPEPDSAPDKGLPSRPTGKPAAAAAAAAAAASSPPTGSSVVPLIKSLTGKSTDAAASVNGKGGSTKSSISANLTKKDGGSKSGTRSRVEERKDDASKTHSTSCRCSRTGSEQRSTHTTS